MFDFEDLDHYELLGVPRGASLEEIKRAYRREISKYHPDRFAGAEAAQQAYAQRRSQAITAAYTTLSDFGARSSYNLGRGPTNAARAPRPTASTGVSNTPRDHQAELYEQARAHLDAGRTVQALGVLRQLQQINPFYRDSADLLLRTEAGLRAREEPKPGFSLRSLFLAGGVLGGAALLALAVWLFGARSISTGAAPLPPATTAEQSTTIVPSVPTPSPAPSSVPATVMATPAAPTPLTTSAPTLLPTAVPVMPTAEPQLANVVPTDLPADQRGEVVLADDFSRGGWASLNGNGWSVGYSEGRYRIAVDGGIGTIWSFRSVTQADVMVAADVQVLSGAGGLVLRFQDEYNYLTLVLEPQQSAYKLEQRDGGVVTVLAAGLSDAIQPGDTAQNRVVARITGNLVQVLVNGKLLSEVEARGASDSPRFGLVAISGDSPAEALFDNYEVRTAE